MARYFIRGQEKTEEVVNKHVRNISSYDADKKGQGVKTVHENGNTTYFGDYFDPIDDTFQDFKIKELNSIMWRATTCIFLILFAITLIVLILNP